MVLFLAESSLSQKGLDFAPLFLRMLLACVVVIVAAFVMLKFVVPKIGTWRRRSGASTIEVLDRAALDANSSLFIVRIEDRKVAIGITTQAIAKICDLGPAEEEA